MQQYFHFTIGPVQGFVAQARRTQDFWAGSFLLSWLSGIAICQVQAQIEKTGCGEILFPKPDLCFIDALKGISTAGGPSQGSIPNRFLAQVSADFDPQAVTRAVQQAWQSLADAVWQQKLEHVLGKTSSAFQIWQRQVSGFWELQWCLTERADESYVLDQRKQIRTHFPPDEPGIKCMMMDGLQELSGITRPDAAKMKHFWESLRENIPPPQLREGEHLSAPALIKRCFRDVFETQKIPLDGVTVHGWRLPQSIPSTSYLAASPWIRKALENTVENEVAVEAWNTFAQQTHVNNLSTEPVNPDWFNTYPSLPDSVSQWLRLDGNLYFPHMLFDEGFCENEDVAKKAEHTFKRLKAAVGLKSPSAFYAIVLMDGDRLGSQMSVQSKQQAISESLSAFTQAVPELVTRYNGFLVYAGGDDVLALLPLDSAIQCATAIREQYEQCFEHAKAAVGIETSISAAVLLTHAKQLLTTQLQRAHSLLDDVAKNRTGRNALAVEIWKPGGLHAQWSQPWDCEYLQQSLAHLQSQTELAVSHGFLSRIAHVLENTNTLNMDPMLIEALIRVEYRRGRKDDIKDGRYLSDETKMIQRFIELCRRWEHGQVQQGFQPDAVKLLHFLVSEQPAKETV
ncbi:type III-B CRISPR-associated protein Cas10/Cmr2 [Gynuella sunshinyii]|uniref:Putative hydrolase of the HD superfamily (Permuted catalytic motifs) n=1 Tax=Gynuella sunshinyii YC6258 TaxID=1445510 RepID=A0A0C5V0Z2_9GAMM|nr:type III-B CRISPR-associated protein Cas10/Cmr2 [Gynuella sunshinyii]AJQ93185.1 putative hydrolase of the HD superfamily (permuted catalytic motifs) [Gynuella sunshinyii YC6258]